MTTLITAAETTQPPTPVYLDMVGMTTCRLFDHCGVFKTCVARLFPSYLMPLFELESSCKTFSMKMSLIYMKMHL